MHRRQFITGLVAFVAAPAIVRASSLMPVRALIPTLDIYGMSPIMRVIADLEYLNELREVPLAAFTLRTVIPADAWRHTIQLASPRNTNAAWLGMPGGRQHG